jgi:histone acetyltransferase 1
VKQRLYIFNRDQLAQVEREERIEKLESALDSVLEAYGKMIERVEAKESEARERNFAPVNGNGIPVVAGAASSSASEPVRGTMRVRKRKVIDDADDDDDAEDEDMEGEGEGEDTTERVVVAVNGHKKARVVQSF